MKKMLIISFALLLILGLAACTAPPTTDSSAPPIEVLPSSLPESTPDSEPQESQTPPIPADAAMYRGTVSDIVSDVGKSTVQFTLTQADGTDFGAPSLKFSFTADTRADFTPEGGQYLEVYYGRAPGAPLSADEVHNVITAIQYHSAEMVSFNGTVKAIDPHPDKPGQGWLVMVPLGVDIHEAESYPESAAPGEPFLGNPEIHYSYDKEKTKFYLNFDEIKVGDKLNIFQSGAMTMSLPPQAFAIEVRPYAQPAKVDVDEAPVALDPSVGFYEMKFDQSVYTGKETTLSYTITNKSTRDSGFGMYEQFQHKVNGEWVDYPTVKELSFPDIAMICEVNSTIDENVDLSYYETPLPPGSYRIVREGADKDYYAEFSVK